LDENCKIFSIPNLKFYVTVAVSADKTINNAIFSLVVGEKAFQGNIDEFKNGNFLHISNVSIPLDTFLRREISTILVEKKQLVLLTFECSASDSSKIVKFK
jgi:hypothetical protein